MTKDEVIKLANDMAFMACIWIDDESNEINDLVKFAKLVAAAEREACAKLVEPDAEHRRDASWGYLGGTEGVELLDSIAKTIRARGSNEAI